MNPAKDGSNDRDAICFTAGPAGAFFAAGTIHAHMAADRVKPAVVAGISMGSLSASALQRCYRELERAQQDPKKTAEKIESARWKWLRQYVAILVDKPANVFWDAIPNPTDFFADGNAPPLTDLSVPCELRIEQHEAHRQKYLLTATGRWVARLPVKVSTLAKLIVHYVRFKEKYTNRVTRVANFFGSAVKVGVQLLFHVIWRPGWVREHIFDGPSTIRPLLGWKVYSAGWFIALLPVLLLASLLGIVEGDWAIKVGSSLVLAGLFLITALIIWRGRLLPSMLASVGFERSLLHNFHLRWRLKKLFGKQTVGAAPMQTLIVAAPLQTLYKTDGSKRVPVAAAQIWANPASDITIVNALSASLALPGLWPPTVVEGSDLEQWSPLKPGRLYPDGVRIDVVDGSVVRQNPLPALLQFLRLHPHIAKLLDRRGEDPTAAFPRPSIHVIYSVPLLGPPGPGHVEEDKANIVDVALASRELARRRDTRLEVEQVKVITRLEMEVQKKGSKTKKPDAAFPDVVVAMADEIAPDATPLEDPNVVSPLVPERERGLRKVAEGCQRTLERLYAKEICELPSPGRLVPCTTLLRSIGGTRPWDDRNAPISEGLPEVCECCPRTLRRSEADPKLPENGTRSLISESLKDEKDKFPNLKVRRDVGKKGEKITEAQPRIVFVWSGGVFRGAFHIGMIGALLESDIKPDLIAAASVGTLMGGALASMFSEIDCGQPLSQRKRKAFVRLGTLVNTFQEVDRKVALTKILKEAARDLGIRASQIRLSAAMIRDTVLAGTQADPGYAATGAPPALIDAISSFFTIPLTDTKTIAGNFVAGLVGEATQCMLLKIKEHSLARLSIQSAVIGSSLLELRAGDLIGGDNVELDHPQPFRGRNIAFLATTTNLGAQASTVLWDDYENYLQPYDFIQAALASSAFPAVFAPRRESDVFPGWGRTDVRYSDGGMFDNLPFQPAIETLLKVQLEESESLKNTPEEMYKYAKDRYENPDLFLTGALNASPESAEGANGPFDYFNEISSRAWSLGDNSKIHSFVGAAVLVDRQLGFLVESGSAIHAHDRDFLRSVVNAAVLPVFPTDVHHLNKTFAFCKTAGLTNEKVLGSVADGCFQTFRTFTDAATSGSDVVKRSIARLQQVRGQQAKLDEVRGMPILKRCRKKCAMIPRI
jgi:predicted acylesterase/phospholipase RssA